MAAARAAGSGRPAAAQVPVSIPAHGRGPGRQARAAERTGAQAVVRARALRAFATGLTLAWAVFAIAQAPALNATVDRPVVRDGESFTYSLRAEGAVRGDPDDA